MNEYLEFYAELKDGTREWVDPILEFDEDEKTICVNNGAFDYWFCKEDLIDWIIRPYHPDTTYDRIER